MPSRRNAVFALAIAGIIILAVYIFIMSTIYCFCVDLAPEVIIEKATLLKIREDLYDLVVSVREVRGVSTTIQKVVLIGGGLDGEKECELKNGQDATLHMGQPKRLIYQCNVQLHPGFTYYVRVYYQKGEGSEVTDLYPVTVR